jgi:hypothetical protein
VYGRLQEKDLSFTIQSECANSGKKIEISLDSELNITKVPEGSDLMFCVALVPLAKTKKPSIVDVF